MWHGVLQDRNCPNGKWKQTPLIHFLLIASSGLQVCVCICTGFKFRVVIYNISVHSSYVESNTKKFYNVPKEFSTFKEKCALVLVTLQAGNCWPSGKPQTRRDWEGSHILLEPLCCVCCGCHRGPVWWEMGITRLKTESEFGAFSLFIC